MDFSHLKGLVIKDTKETKRKPKEIKNPPTGYTVRVYSNGKVYPSEELVRKFKLEYTSNAEGTHPGYGFDLFDSRNWKPLQDQQRMLIFGLVERTENKIDLFPMTKHKEDGTPISSVLTQGSSCPTLLELVKSMNYLYENERYVDLTLHVEHEFTTDNGVAYIPKVVERGDRKGTETYERRDNVRFFPVTNGKHYGVTSSPKGDLTTGQVLQEN